MSFHRLLGTATAVLVLATGLVAQEQHTVFTDADSTVRVICRNDEAEEQCFEPRGTDDNILDDWSDNPRYVRVHDQNALDAGYWHFDLGDVAADAEVTSATFQLDAQSNSWGNTTVAVFAVMNSAADWNLDDVPEAEIYGENAPQADWFGWDGDPNNAQRFNAPTPFLDEGSGKSAVVRELDVEILIESTDADTEGTVDDPGNDYGGYACCDGEGTGGSSDGGDNPWPIKDAVEVDVTDLIRWKLGQNPDYSDFTPDDRELTLMVRTDFPTEGGTNGFARFVAKESEFLGGDLDLAPGRIVLSGSGLQGGGIPGDFDGDGELTENDINLLTSAARSLNHDPTFDLTGDNLVNGDDRVFWVEELRKSYLGDSNLDGEFSSGDFVFVFTAGEYEDNIAENSRWETGDWNGDGEFDTSDFVAAFTAGGYEAGPRTAQGVPEPTALWLLVLGCASLVGFRRQRKRE